MINKKIDEKIHNIEDKRRTQQKVGLVIICIGKKGVGKSTTVREILKGIKSLNPEKEFNIYDPNTEFAEYDNFDIEQENAFKVFVDNRLKPAKSSVLFVEEATIFLDPKKREGVLVDKMVKARHDQNIIIMNFHSWRSVPVYIFDMIDYLYLHKSNDTEQKVKYKCDIPFVLEAFREVNNNPSKYYKKLIDFNQ